MNQRWILNIFGVTLALLCFSCTGFFEIEGEEKIEPYDNPAAVPTLVKFNNQKNSYSVDVFSSSYRDKAIISVERNSWSESLSWVATDSDGYNFYLAYNFNFEGCKIPYIPPMGNYASSVNVRIYRGKENTVSIPPLGDYISKTQRLSNDIWLIIKNTGYSQLRLTRGSESVFNEKNETTVDAGQTGIYKFPATADSSSYKIRVGTTTTETPLPFNIFNPGSVHVVTFTGVTAALTRITELTLENLSQ